MDGTVIYQRNANGTLRKLVTQNSATSFRLLKSFTFQENENKETKKFFPAKTPVPSLYSQCMELLSNFTHCFESLVDFPLDFGKEIFMKAADKLLTDSFITRASLETFNDAYQEFLSSCSLVNSLPLLNNYELSVPMLLKNVVSLELIQSDIDDDHDILDVLVKLEYLQNLNLSSNSITDKGIRRMVLPLLDKKKVSSLRYLDISFNKLNEKSIRRMVLVSKLAVIIIGEKDLNDAESCFQPHFSKKACPRLMKIETTGFGSILLDKWNQRISDNKKNRAPTKASSFYSTPNILKEIGNTIPITHDKSGSKIMFSRRKSAPKSIPNSLSLKRSFNCDTELESQRKKPKTLLSDLTNCDQDLMKLYS